MFAARIVGENQLANEIRTGGIGVVHSISPKAKSRRVSTVSRPSASSVSNSGGAFLRPHTATRMGWNICPVLRITLKELTGKVEAAALSANVPPPSSCARACGVRVRVYLGDTQNRPYVDT